MTPKKGSLDFFIDEDEESPQVNSSAQKSTSECIHVQLALPICLFQTKKGSDNTNVRWERPTTVYVVMSLRPQASRDFAI